MGSTHPRQGDQEPARRPSGYAKEASFNQQQLMKTVHAKYRHRRRQNHANLKIHLCAASEAGHGVHARRDCLNEPKLSRDSEIS